ncbi:MAG TPA: hypothetical protein VGC66_12310 [Pyrinomonadaceae bacterium]|jgi:hypothetical protein
MAFPKADPQLVIWFKNFAQAFATHGPALGFTAAEVTSVENDAQMMDFLISDMLPTYKAGLQSRTAYKTLIKDGPIGATAGPLPTASAPVVPLVTVAPGILPRLRQLIQRIKVAPGYTESIGEDLGITGEDTGSSIPETDTAKPTFKATPQPGANVRIDFEKRGFDGVLVESRRTGETNWTQLGIDLYSPFVDTRPPAQPNTPEVREYRLRYYDGDEAVGQWSDIITATITP